MGFGRLICNFLDITNIHYLGANIEGVQNAQKIVAPGKRRNIFVKWKEMLLVAGRRVCIAWRVTDAVTSLLTTIYVDSVSIALT